MNKADSNRVNAQSSTGPRDTTLTRLNAVKHALLAKGITELDDSTPMNPGPKGSLKNTARLGIWRSSSSKALPST